MYAVVRRGNRQYRVSPGETILVERLSTSEEKVEFSPLIIADGEKIKVGNPELPGAKVVARVLGEEKGDKVTVFKYKRKVRYRRRRGHRPIFTRLSIEEIEDGT
jgi:large subunit ribosomal protein L21